MSFTEEVVAAAVVVAVALPELIGVHLADGAEDVRHPFRYSNSYRRKRNHPNNADHRSSRRGGQHLYAYLRSSHSLLSQE